MIYNHRGMRIAGLGASRKYKEGPDMYTEKEMASRVRRLRRKARFTGGIDLLVTHAPPAGYGDLEDLPHRGFACFNDLLMKLRPAYLLHGHVHKNYTRGFERRRSHPSGAVIINAYESYILEIPDTEYPEFGKTGSILYDRYCGIMEKFRWFGRNPF
jgi:Icc-related predicted phosphoesterase